MNGGGWGLPFASAGDRHCSFPLLSSFKTSSKTLPQLLLSYSTFHGPSMQPSPNPASPPSSHIPCCSAPCSFAHQSNRPRRRSSPGPTLQSTPTVDVHWSWLTMPFLLLLHPNSPPPPPSFISTTSCNGLHPPSTLLPGHPIDNTVSPGTQDAGRMLIGQLNG